MQSGIVREKLYVFAEPDIIADTRIRRIGVIIPLGSEMTPYKLLKEAEEIAKRDGCRVIIEWRHQKEKRNVH